MFSLLVQFPCKNQPIFSHTMNKLNHQIITNSSDSFTNIKFRIYEFLNEYLLWFLFQLANWKKKICFGLIRSLFSFSTNKKFVEKKIRETNWWKIWWIRFKSIIQLQGENGIERLDLSLKDSDHTELLWSLNAIYSREIWEEGRVHFKSKSTAKTYEYAVWIFKIIL